MEQAYHKGADFDRYILWLPQIERIKPAMSDNPYQKPSPFGGQQNQNGQNGNPQQGPFGQQQGQQNHFGQQGQQFPQQPQQGGFPQQGGYPQQQQGGFPQQQPQGFPQQGGYPQQQQPQPGYQQPQQFGQQNGYPQQNQYQPGYNQQPGIPPQGPPNNNKSLWIIIVSVVVGILVIGGLVIAAAFAFGGTKGESSPNGNDRGTSAENPISLKPLESTGNASKDAKFDKGYSRLDIPTLTQDKARGVAFDTCAYLKTDPTKQEFEDNFLGGKSSSEAYDLGQALGVGIPVYCPSEIDTLTDLIPAG